MKDFLLKPIAHRGLHDKNNPENSLGAFQRALDNFYPIELDVHLIKDKELIVFHDHNLKRMTGLDKLVKDLTLAELRDIRLGDTNHHIPSFKEVLKLVDGRVPLLIEIKKQAEAKETIRLLLDILKDYMGAYALQSFYPDYLYYLRKLGPHIKRGQLASCEFPESTIFLQKVVSKYMLLNFLTKPDFINYNYRCIPLKVVTNFRKKGKPVIAYTLTSPKDEGLVKDHIDNFIFEQYIPNNQGSNQQL